MIQILNTLNRSRARQGHTDATMDNIDLENFRHWTCVKRHNSGVSFSFLSIFDPSGIIRRPMKSYLAGVHSTDLPTLCGRPTFQIYSQTLLWRWFELIIADVHYTADCKFQSFTENLNLELPRN
jgi:hypothetical protein